MTFGAPSAFAATDAPPADAAPAVNPLELSPEQLFGATVTVTSVSGVAETAWDAPAAITVLTGEDIHRSGATSIPEALRMVPGVQVARTAASGWAVSIRGFNGALDNKLLVLIDGREVYDHLFSGVYWDIQDLPLEDVDRIEVIRGPGATLWGANAVNGVINVITKDASATQGGLVSALAGNQERLTSVGRYGGKFGSTGYYRVYGKYLARNDETSATPGVGSAEDAFASWRSGFRSDWSAASDKFTVQGDAYRGDSHSFHNTPNTAAAPFFTRTLDSSTPDGANLEARWTRSFTPDSSLEVLGYVDYTHREDAQVLGDRRTSFNLQAQYDFPAWNRHKFIAGARYWLSQDRVTATPSGVVSAGSPSRTDQLYSAFLQDKITLAPDRWSLTLGSKIEHNVFTGFEVEPSARLQWTPDNTHVLWASVSRAVRTPSQLEEQLRLLAGVIPGAPPTAAFLVPNTAFQSEVLVAYEAGYRQRLTPDATLDVATFFNDYSKLETAHFNPLDFSTLPAFITLPISLTNEAKGETYGVETTVDWQARRNLKLTASNTFLQMTLHGPNAASETAEKQSPQNQLSLQSRWDVTDRLAWDVMGYHVAPLSAFSVADYWRLDTRLGWKFTEGVEGELIGQNLLHQTHREFSSPTDPSAIYVDRSLFARVTCRF